MDPALLAHQILAAVGVVALDRLAAHVWRRFRGRRTTPAMLTESQITAVAFKLKQRRGTSKQATEEHVRRVLADVAEISAIAEQELRLAIVPIPTSAVLHLPVDEEPPVDVHPVPIQPLDAVQPENVRSLFAAVVKREAAEPSPDVDEPAEEEPELDEDTVDDDVDELPADEVDEPEAEESIDPEPEPAPPPAKPAKPAKKKA